MHSQRIATVAAIAVGITVAVSGCSGGSSGVGTVAQSTPTPQHHRHHKSPSPTPTPTPTPSPTVTVTASTAATVTATPTATMSAAPTTQNLTVTAAVRKQLVKAGADTHQLPAADYTGLAPGETYYAYDAATGTYWAGAGLVPSPSSQDAQISVQDDGSYLVFNKHGNGVWAGYNVGLAGIPGAHCPIKPPAAIVTLWGWDKHTCRPPG